MWAPLRPVGDEKGPAGSRCGSPVRPLPPDGVGHSINTTAKERWGCLEKSRTRQKFEQNMWLIA